MTQHQAFIDPVLLADQSTWVLSLAHSLVRDPSGAADVAQETLLAGLAAPPQDAADPRRLRAWLGRVVFNLAHLSTRRSVRRRAREEEVARPERQDSAADTAIRKAVLRRVGEAVDGLREPYRSVVIMRYFEGLSTAAIASASQTSESAVRKRLWRARVQLRRDLEPQHNGERQAWFQAALPLLGVDYVGRPQAPLGGPSWLGASTGVVAAKLLAGAAATLLVFSAMGSDSLGAVPGEPVADRGRAAPQKHGPQQHRAAFLGYMRSDPSPDSGKEK